jgi:hypothetical protein
MATDKSAVPGKRAPIWPVIIAPLVAGVYYLAVKLAFAQSIISVLGQTASIDIDLSDLARPQWGSHWVYRAVAEAISIACATFVAAGIARGRELAAAIVGGCTISIGFALKLALLFIGWKYLDADDFSAPEPWYQYMIDFAMLGAAPLIGIYVTEAARDQNEQEPRGFAGMNRWHFLWLWIPTFWYAVGLITPLSRFYSLPEPSIVTSVLTFIVNFIPAAAVAIPGYYGMALLAGHHGDTMHPAGRNLVGVLVLIFGFMVGAAIQTAWFYGLHWIWTAIFG